MYVLDELILWGLHYVVQHPWHQKAKRTEAERGRKGGEGKAFVSLVLRAHSLMSPVYVCVYYLLTKKTKHFKTPHSQFFEISSISVIVFIVRVLSEGQWKDIFLLL